MKFLTDEKSSTDNFHKKKIRGCLIIRGELASVGLFLSVGEKN